MITGFNTDVKHNAKVYHVQTEDKGRDNPKIETLVYVGGEILDNYRTSYDQSRAQMSEDEIMELLESQHKRVIRSIKIGKYDQATPFEEGLISDRSLDEVIAAYLTEEPAPDHLKLVANGLAGLFRERKGTLQIETLKAVSGEAAPHVRVRVKLTATQQSSITLDHGESDAKGRLSLQLDLPQQSPEGGALVIQGISEWGVAEMKYPLQR